MTNVPQTMTNAGLAFLGALAGEAGDGVILEVGPLFGSSTNAIDRGRRSKTTPIHTIDTFDPAPWVRERVGIDLSREMFDKFTSHIENLHVHQGYAPDIVTGTWKEKIGFYFDDATHGDPGWSNNYNFFSPFFSDDAIICGDDFAGGWPDIITNVYRIAGEYGAKLFVIGRVWALARQGEDRIQKVVDRLYPGLAGATVTTTHAGATNSMAAACWSYGLHRQVPLDRLAIDGAGKMDGQIVVYRGGKITGTVSLDGTPVDIGGAEQVYISAGARNRFQFCTVNARGKTSNSKAEKSGTLFTVPKGEAIVALRFSA